MKIAIFTDTYFPDINGVVTSVEMERKKLEERGHDVYVVCTYPGALKIKKEGKIIRLPGIEIKQLYGYAIASPVHFLLIDELRTIGFDVIHAETEFGVGIFANICARHLDLPLVRTYHTTYEDYTHYLNFINSKIVDTGLKKAVALISKTYGDNCMRLISPSTKTEEMLTGYGITNTIEIIPTGIDIKRFKNDRSDQEAVLAIREECGAGPGEKLLMYVGRLAEEKSIDQIIIAFKKIKELKIPVHFALVGDGPQFSKLKEMVDSLDLNDHIVFLGKKPFAIIPQYYHAADAFISASTSETQGMTYIEALAAGLPVIAHYDKVLDDIVDNGKNGFFFNDEEELLDAIVKITSMDSGEYAELASCAARSVIQYDSDAFGDKLEKLFMTVIDEYRDSFWITKTTLKDDYVTLTLKNAADEKLKLDLSLDDYYSCGFRSDSKIIRTVYEELSKKEKILKAYRSCLRKLSAHDRTIAQMRKHLYQNCGLDTAETDIIIDKLKKKKLLDDRTYAVSRISYLNLASVSRKMMVRKLKEDGISDEIIEETLQTDKETEKYKAIRKAEKYRNMSHNKSLAAKKRMIVSKLINEGFSSEVANAALDVLDFSDEIFSQKDLLRKEASKAYRKYERKYSDSELRNRIFKTLVSKGFSYEEIYCVINEMGW